MATDLQKAALGKRIAAWLFDILLTAALAVALGVLLSALLGYDTHSQILDGAYAKYEQEYGVVFDISQAEFDAMTEAQKINYNLAYAALVADEGAMYAYNMMLNLTLVILTLAILAAVLIWEFGIPLYFGNGQTLGKKIFGLCLIRNDGVQMNTMQLFARSVLGKYTIETMIPVLILLMIFWGTMGIMGTVVLAVLGIGQLVSIAVTKTDSAIHDLLAGTVVVDYASQTIFRSTEDLIRYQKERAAERAARAPY